MRAFGGIACAWLALAGAGSGRAQEIFELSGEDRALDIDFEDLYLLGSPTGAEWEQFGHVASVGFDEAGNLLVFDRQSDLQRVFLVGPDGGLIREVGRPGEGPGEFSHLAGAAIMRDGRVVLVDHDRRGHHLFHADGRFDRLVRMSGSPGAWAIGPVRSQPGADALVGVPGQATAVTMTGRAFAGPIVLPSSLVIERTVLSGEWTETDTIAEAWLPPTGLENLGENTQRNYLHMPTVLLPRWSPSLHWRVLPDGGVAFSDSTTWTVKIAEAGAGVVRILLRPHRPAPVTGRMIRTDGERRLGTRWEGRGPTRWAEGLYSEDYYHEVPVIHGLAATWDGRLWVLRAGEDPWSDGPIDVVAPDGRYFGTLRAGTPLPDAFGPRGLAAFVEMDEMGVQTVVVRRVSR